MTFGFIFGCVLEPTQLVFAQQGGITTLYRLATAPERTLKKKACRGFAKLAQNGMFALV